ncbi:hypothetical protein T484DRAFT_1765028 [Baffinella frigidus]|nr:hypothetical protein T484DRAFT_1765028 [Cryptophyta sp. CCMP2293]
MVLSNILDVLMVLSILALFIQMAASDPFFDNTGFEKEHVVGHDAGRVHLAWAARAGDVAAVRALLEYKDAQDEGGFSALHWAVSQAEKGDEELDAALLADGASVKPPDRAGQTPLMLARDGGHEAVARMLEKRGAT